MKKNTILFLTICATALIYVSCSKEETANQKEETANQSDISSIGASVTFDATTEMDVKSGLLITTNTGTLKSVAAAIEVCPSITIQKPTAEEYPKIFMVDYGLACTRNQITRKGKLKITLTGPITTTGSKMTIERSNYSINGIKLEGTITYTNATTNQAVPTWTRKIENGKLVDAVSNVYTGFGSYTVKQTEGFSTVTLEDNVYEITNGKHTITTDKGETLILTVQEPLVKKYSCEFVSKGKLQIEGHLLNGVIDYGNNSCDNQYTYTHESGVVYTLAI